MTRAANYTNPAQQRLLRVVDLLAGHELHGLAPGEIAKGLGVPPSWVSQNLPALEAETGFVERVEGTNRWRLGVPLVRIAITVSSNLNQAKRQLEELSQRYAVPVHTPKER